ncbi:MAG: MarR family transcriptional regulator [Candidatus Bathyarchaeia archaeon]
MNEILLLFASVFFVTAMVAALEYYKHIVKIKEEYTKAKETFKDIILSFSRELKRNSEAIEIVASKIESSTKDSKLLKRIEDFEKRLSALEEKINTIPNELKMETTKIIEELNGKIRDIVASQEILSSHISQLNEKTQKLMEVPELKVDAVIPIKKEKALAPLTDTELRVLELLATEGPKTAPEIKEKIKLSREHTARLMKKLYVEGYLERDSSKIPFRYSLKKEMESILKKE